MDNETKSRWAAHIGKRIDDAFAKRPFRGGSPTFGDIKAAIVAAFVAAEEGLSDDPVSEPSSLPRLPPNPSPARPPVK